MTRGDYTPLDGTWNCTAATGLDGTLYLASDNALYRVAADGAYATIGEDAWQSRFLVGIDGALIAIEPGGGMYRISPADGTWTQLEGNWENTIAAAATGGSVFVIERSGTLYRVSPRDGSYEELDSGYANTVCFAAAGDTLIAIDESGSIHRVSAADGSWEQLPETWSGAVAAAGDARGFYVVTQQSMYAVSPTDGSYETLTETTWNARHLATAGGVLYEIEQSGSLYRIDLQ